MKFPCASCGVEDHHDGDTCEHCGGSTVNAPREKKWREMTPQEKAREAAPRLSPVRAGVILCPSSKALGYSAKQDDPDHYLLTNTPDGWSCSCKGGQKRAVCWHLVALSIQLDRMAKHGKFEAVAFWCGDDKAFKGHAPAPIPSADEVLFQFHSGSIETQYVPS